MPIHYITSNLYEGLRSVLADDNTQLNPFNRRAIDNLTNIPY